MRTRAQPAAGSESLRQAFSAGRYIVTSRPTGFSTTCGAFQVFFMGTVSLVCCASCADATWVASAATSTVESYRSGLWVRSGAGWARIPDHLSWARCRKEVDL